MFPNPQAALPLPEHPDLEQYKKLAKELLRAAKATDSDAIRDWSTSWVRTLVERSGVEIAPPVSVRIDGWASDVTDFARAKLSEGGKLADAQFVIARSHGFPSWPRFIKHIRNAIHADSAEAQFETAVDAIVNGDTAALRRLLRTNPKLAHMRSSREHGATLLHYVSANGVEGYRQKAPKNAVEIAEELLRAGSDVDAGAEVYGSRCTALGLVATSGPPQQAGVQRPLLELLLAAGASLDRPGLAGAAGSLVRACFANGQPEAAKFLADRGAPLDLETAAGVGSLELVKSFFTADGTLQPPATQRHLQSGFLLACMRGEEEVAVFLLEHGAAPDDPADTGATALHWAAGAAHVGLVRRLLQPGAPLEVINRWGGTVLEHAGYGFQHGPSAVDFVPTFEALLAAGAKIRGSWISWIESVNSRPAEEKARLSDVLRRYGAMT
jgi:ankyrin repeat protein